MPSPHEQGSIWQRLQLDDGPSGDVVRALRVTDSMELPYISVYILGLGGHPLL